MYIIVNQVTFKFDNSQPPWDLWKSSWLDTYNESNGNHFEYLLVKNETKW